MDEIRVLEMNEWNIKEERRKWVVVVGGGDSVVKLNFN